MAVGDLKGFGGDIYGQYVDYLALKNGIKQLYLGSLIDSSFKILAYGLSSSFESYAKYLQLKTWLVNLIFFLIAWPRSQRVFSPLAGDAKLLVFYFFCFNPYFLATIFAGHTSFYIAFALIVATARGQISAALVMLGVGALLNPYILVLGLVFRVCVRIIWAEASRDMSWFPEFFALLVAALFLGFDLRDLVWNVVDRDVGATGLLPHHLLMPPVSSLAGLESGYVSMVNRLTVYSNVPEMQHFVGVPLLAVSVSVLSGNLNWRAPVIWRLVVLLAMYIFIAFPTQTSHFGDTVQFPSAIFNALFEDIRIISRLGLVVPFGLLLIALRYFDWARMEKSALYRRARVAVIACFLVVELPANPKLALAEEWDDNIRLSGSCMMINRWSQYYAFMSFARINDSVDCDTREFDAEARAQMSRDRGKLSEDNLEISL